MASHTLAGERERHRGRTGVGLLFLILASGCADEIDGAASDNVQAESTSEGAPASAESTDSGATGSSGTTPDTTVPPSAAGDGSEPATPADLPGTWVSTALDDSELVLRLHDDGSYERVGVLMQATPSGNRSFIHEEKGGFRVDETVLRLDPTWAHDTFEDPEVPSANYDKSVQPNPTTYTWSFEGGLLTLVGEVWTPQGPTLAPITYKRQP